jgi:hypothetical protein
MPISHAERYRRTISGLMSTLRRLGTWTERVREWTNTDEEDVRELCQGIDAGVAALQELILLLAYRLEGVDITQIGTDTDDASSS